MLVINQQLDKLAAMHTDFIARSILPAGHTPRRNISANPNPKQVIPNNNDDNDDSPVEEDVLGHVVLAHTCGKPFLRLLCKCYLNLSSMFPSTGYEQPLPLHYRTKSILHDTGVYRNTGWRAC